MDECKQAAAERDTKQRERVCQLKVHLLCNVMGVYQASHVHTQSYCAAPVLSASPVAIQTASSFVSLSNGAFFATLSAAAECCSLSEKHSEWRNTRL